MLKTTCCDFKSLRVRWKGRAARLGMAIIIGLSCPFTAPVNSLASTPSNPRDDLSTSDFGDTGLDLLPIFDLSEGLMERALFPSSPGAGGRPQGKPNLSEVRKLETDLQDFKRKLQREWSQLRPLVDRNYGLCQDEQRAAALEQERAREEGRDPSQITVPTCYDQQLNSLTLSFYRQASRLELIYMLLNLSEGVNRASRWGDLYAIRIPWLTLSSPSLLAFWSEQKSRLRDPQQAMSDENLITLNWVDTDPQALSGHLRLDLKSDLVFALENQVQLARHQDAENVLQLGRYLAARNLYENQVRIWLSRGRNPSDMPLPPTALLGLSPSLNLLWKREFDLAKKRSLGLSESPAWIDVKDSAAQSAIHEGWFDKSSFEALFTSLSEPLDRRTSAFAQALLVARRNGAIPVADQVETLDRNFKLVLEGRVPLIFRRMLNFYDVNPKKSVQQTQTEISALFRRSVAMAYIAELVLPTNFDERQLAMQALNSSIETLIPDSRQDRVNISAWARGALQSYNVTNPENVRAEAIIAPLRRSANDLKQNLDNLDELAAEPGILFQVFADTLRSNGASTRVMGFAESLGQKSGYQDARVEFNTVLSDLMAQMQRFQPMIAPPALTRPLDQSYQVNEILRWITAARATLERAPRTQNANGSLINQSDLVRGTFSELEQLVSLGQTFRFFQTSQLSEVKVKDLNLSTEERRAYRREFLDTALTINPVLGSVIPEKNPGLWSRTRNAVLTLWYQDAQEENYTFLDPSPANLSTALDVVERNLTENLQKIATTRSFEDIGYLMTNSFFMRETFEKALPEWREPYRQASIEHLKPSLGRLVSSGLLEGAGVPANVGFATMLVLLVKRWVPPVRAADDFLREAFRGKSRILYGLFGSYMAGEMAAQGVDLGRASHQLGEARSWYQTNVNRPGFVRSQDVEQLRQLQHDQIGNLTLSAAIAGAIGVHASITGIRAFRQGSLMRSERRLQYQLTRILQLPTPNGRPLPPDYFQSRNVLGALEDVVTANRNALARGGNGVSSSVSARLTREQQRLLLDMEKEAKSALARIESEIDRVADSLRTLGAERAHIFDGVQLMRLRDARLAEAGVIAEGGATPVFTLPQGLSAGEARAIHRQIREVMAEWRKVSHVSNRLSTDLLDAPVLRQALLNLDSVPPYYRALNGNFSFARGDDAVRELFPDVFRNVRGGFDSAEQELLAILRIERVSGELIRRAPMRMEPNLLQRLRRQPGRLVELERDLLREMRIP